MWPGLPCRHGPLHAGPPWENSSQTQDSQPKRRRTQPDRRPYDSWTGSSADGQRLLLHPVLEAGNPAGKILRRAKGNLHHAGDFPGRFICKEADCRDQAGPAVQISMESLPRGARHNPAGAPRPSAEICSTPRSSDLSRFFE